MASGTVVTLAEIEPVEGPESSLPARVCAAIALLNPVPPLVIVADGPLALLLPAVALAQRGAHRRVCGYVLVDPDLPPVTDMWPDAPVTLVTDDVDGDTARQARLRDWRVLSRADYAQHATDLDTV